MAGNVLASAQTNTTPNSTIDVHADSPEIIYLAKTIYGEARGESYESKLAVGWVIRNRVQLGRWGGTYRSVVTAPYQFTCWSQRIDPHNYSAIQNPSGKAWQDSLKAAREVYAAAPERNLVPGATHYYSPISQAALHQRNPTVYPAQPSFMRPPSQPEQIPNPSGVPNEKFIFFKGIR